MDFDVLNRAVVAYFAEGEASPNHLLGEAGFAESQEVAQAVASLVRESLSIPAHWTTTSSVAGASIMKHEMQRRHKQLDEAALEALAAHFASSWR